MIQDLKDYVRKKNLRAKIALVDFCDVKNLGYSFSRSEIETYFRLMNMEKSKETKEAELFFNLTEEAKQISKTEPLLKCLLERTILNPKVQTFNDLIATTISHRLSTMTSSENGTPDVCPLVVKKMLSTALSSEELELGHTMTEAVQKDAEAVVRRDPACDSILEVILYFKGFAALVCHRAARRHWKKKYKNGSANEENSNGISVYTKHVALWLQSQASAAFGVDIHPGAQIGKGVMFDHGTGIVIGETAVIGDGCTLLHGVTLGGTGKESGDRHPKIGKDVLIGAGASVLGNISVGDSAKIGSGAIVLKPIPSGATAVGAPARIIGWAKEKRPGSYVDLAMLNVTKRQTSFHSSLSKLTLDDALSKDNLDMDDANETKQTNIDEDKTGDETLSNYFCPFKEINTNLNSNAFPTSVAMKSISSVLKEESCTDSEVHEVYSQILRLSFSNLSKRSVREKSIDAVRKLTNISMEKAENIADLLFDDYSNS